MTSPRHLLPAGRLVVAGPVLAIAAQCALACSTLRHPVTAVLIPADGSTGWVSDAAEPLAAHAHFERLP